MSVVRLGAVGDRVAGAVVMDADEYIRPAGIGDGRALGQADEQVSDPRHLYNDSVFLKVRILLCLSIVSFCT